MAIARSISNPTPTATRVQRNTAPEVNQRISRDSESSLAQAASTRDNVEHRLAELEEEWDIERVLQTNFGIINLASITMGALLARPFFLVTGIAAFFMAKHALEGWCPPVPVFRRLGCRTSSEIAQERYALKALRGDFEGVPEGKPEDALNAAAIPSSA